MLGIHPAILVGIVCSALGIFTLAMAFGARRLGTKILWVVATFILFAPGMFVFVALNPELVDDRYRTYKAFYRDLHQGMTREEVFATLDKRYPPGGPRKRPKSAGEQTDYAMGFFMDPEDSVEPNCEGIFIKLNHGHVESVTYSPD